MTARRYMMNGGDYVMLIDDLESNRSSQASAVFDRYRLALDTILPANLVANAAVHFLVNMLEAYYLADSKALNSVLGTNWQDFNGDVETIPHPKNELRTLHPDFDEKEHGPLIVRVLDVMHILARPDACASLRTIFAWAVEATRSTLALPDGPLFHVTKSQIDALRQTKAI